MKQDKQCKQCKKCKLCGEKITDEFDDVRSPENDIFKNICNICSANLSIAFWEEYHRIKKEAKKYNI